MHYPGQDIPIHFVGVAFQETDDSMQQRHLVGKETVRSHIQHIAHAAESQEQMGDCWPIRNQTQAGIQKRQQALSNNIAGRLRARF